VTTQPLAPVIPSSSLPAGRRRACLGPAAAAGRPVPVLSAPGDVVYGTGRIDASDRIVDRAVISALGWRGGDRLTLTADAGGGDRPPRP